MKKYILFIVISLIILTINSCKKDCASPPTLSLAQAENPGYTCADSICIENAFTPNGTGINDFLRVTGPGNTELTITDNCSNVLFQTINATHSFWDGAYNGHPVANGIYEYTINTNLLRGQIQLVR